MCRITVLLRSKYSVLYNIVILVKVYRTSSNAVPLEPYDWSSLELCKNLTLYTYIGHYYVVQP